MITLALQEKKLKSGFITILGKPNAGKSTLLNTLVGQKVSIVSWRPQTTRNKITGIMNGEYKGEPVQAIFIDTPGIYQGKSLLSKYMEDSINTAAVGVDIIIYVLDGEKRIHTDDLSNIEKYKKSAAKTIVVVNKMDLAPRDMMVQNLTELNSVEGIAVIPISAVKNDNINILVEEVFKDLKDGEQFYPEDMITDKPLRFMTAEIIREKALIFLQEEIPHGIGVEILNYSVREDGLTSVECDVICERDTHKAIIIGKGGEMLKRISTAARKEMEKLIGDRVYLKLWVKVKPNWKDNNSLLINLGYNLKDL
ncbi:MAG: GTPase Era [Clostridia bacterium]|nr:GTPase Era [Clostridia bacterium]